MNKWPHKVEPHTREEILEAVQDKVWQVIRMHMKGMPTPGKLFILNRYYEEHLNLPESGEVKIQIDNYINALKRGGQLNDKLEVVR